MIRAVVVDDDLSNQKHLKVLLEDQCEGVLVSGAASTVVEAKKLIDNENPDVVFLSIHKGNETGFELIDLLKQVPFEVVFIATDTNYAFKAIKYFALDYLVTPVEIADLGASIEKVKIRVENKKISSESIKVLLQNINTPKVRNQRLAIPTAKGILFINIHDIIYCQGQGNYTLVHTCSGDKHMVGKTLKEYDSILTEHNFFRIHKSFLINLNEIKGYIQGDNSVVIMSNDDNLMLSKRRREEFFDTCILTNKTLIRKSNVINDIKYLSSGNNQKDE